ncbi:MAG: hypothetical protein ACOYOP_07935 [Microthrixaceae bacterium]
MITILFVPLLVIGAVVALVLDRRHGRVEGFRFLRAIALSLAVLFAAFAGLFIAGETFDDPGGATAALLVAAWLVPLSVLTATAWWWPRVATPVLGVAVAVVCAIGVGYAVDATAWRTFEDGHGPVRAIIVFALTLPLAVLAWRRSIVGGGLLLTLAVVPGLLAVLGNVVAGPGGGAPSSAIAATTPAALIGVLFLAAGLLRRRRRRTDDRPPDRGILDVCSA